MMSRAKPEKNCFPCAIVEMAWSSEAGARAKRTAPFAPQDDDQDVRVFSQRGDLLGEASEQGAGEGIPLGMEEAEGRDAVADGGRDGPGVDR